MTNQRTSTAAEGSVQPASLQVGCEAFELDATGDILAPRAQVTRAELRRMPPSLTPAEAMPWTRLSRSAFYKMLAEGAIASCRLGHSIRIPTRRFLLSIGVLEEDGE